MGECENVRMCELKKINSYIRTFSFMILLVCFCVISSAQKRSPVYVDQDGVMRSTTANKEVAYFGVNYTVPFAFGYRSHKALGLDIEKAIDADVYHLARLRVDAFRVHVWDTEISDTNGNLLENEHLRLYDYLLMRLKERNIKILFTPLAYWGNGYPDRDENTPGFSRIYNKSRVLVVENAIRAQENYLRQILKHINPYTKLSYGDDPDVIALEINNEPHHSGPKDKVREYISRMVSAVRSTGWIKPVFYNISESPSYADVVASSDIQGVSFQWYPTGLVANHEQRGNYLPHVDAYSIPFGDTIPAYRNKARAVYEFDAADVLQPIMYPAMARSFRTAGFQWATQFAYDPLATANVNTEYQTHYLNLAYTPSKAISLLIASRAFHIIPRLKNYGRYPADTLFDVFRVSYKQSLSEMNSDSEFYYSNNTAAVPKNSKMLRHIAGVGSSPVLNYEGTGAYFLDKLNKSSWRFEVMPDLEQLSDPFSRASAAKEVGRLKWVSHKISIDLPGLQIKGIVKPGTYLIEKGKFSKIPDQFFYPANLDTSLMIRTYDVMRQEIRNKMATQLYDPNIDKQLNIYNRDWRNITFTTVAAGPENKSALRISSKTDLQTGFQNYFGDRITWRRDISEFNKLVIDARSDQPGVKVKIKLITVNGIAYSAELKPGNDFAETRIPFNMMVADSFLLLPRPYPGFLPLNFKADLKQTFSFSDAERLEVSFEGKGVVEIRSVFISK